MGDGIRFDTKIAVLVRDDLETWQRLNATAFLVSGIVAACPQLIGEAYEDADGTPYLPLLGQPVVVLEADAATVKAAHARALSRELPMSVYTREMFSTGNDLANRRWCARWPATSSTWSGSRCTGRRTASTRR